MNRKYKNPVVRSLGILLLVLPLVPLNLIFGAIKGLSGTLGARDWALALIISALTTLLAAIISSWYLRAGRKFQWTSTPSALLSRQQALRLLVVTIVFVELLLINIFCFSSRPILVDSIAQFWQAKIFASGHLISPVPHPYEFFVIQHMVQDGPRWFAQYPPLHSALLAPFILSGCGWLLAPLLSSCSTFLMALSARNVYGSATERRFLAIVPFCPFFLCLGASFMNHVSFLFFSSLFLWLLTSWDRRRLKCLPILCGVCLGAAFCIRPLSALLIALATVPMLLTQVRSRSEWIRLVSFGAGFTITGSLYLVFNFYSTGDPLLPGYIRLWGAAHSLGFHLDPWGELHTPLRGLKNQLVNIYLLNEYLFESLAPGLYILALPCALGLMKSRWDTRLLSFFFVIPLGYFLYWHRDNFLGPRYLYDGLAFLLPLLARGTHLCERWVSQLTKKNLSFLSVSPKRLWYTFLMVNFCFVLLWGAPRRLIAYGASFFSMKRSIIEEAQERGIENGLVFIKVSFTNRLAARMHAAGLSASFIEYQLRQKDHCEINSLLNRYDAEQIDLVEALQQLSSEQVLRPLQYVRSIEGITLFDSALMLRAGRRLSGECRDELQYDSEGFVAYAPFFIENDVFIDGDFVIARDMRGRNTKLISIYKNLPAYRYELLPAFKSSAESSFVRLTSDR